MINLGIPYTNCGVTSGLPCSTEEEAFAIAVGIYLGGGQVNVFMQNSGFGRCLDIITSFLIPYDINIQHDIENREDLHHCYMGKLLPKLCEELKQLKK